MGHMAKGAAQIALALSIMAGGTPGIAAQPEKAAPSASAGTTPADQANRRKCRPSTDPADPAQVRSLASDVLAKIRAQPKSATVDDVQGVAAFAIDQSGMTDSVVLAALGEVLNAKLTQVQRLAIQNLLRARSCGTGALPGGGLSLGAGPGGGGGGVGGGSDYSTP